MTTGNVPSLQQQTVSNVVPWYNQHREPIQNAAITLLVASILTLVTAVLLKVYPHSSSAFIATFSATTVLSSCVWVAAHYLGKDSPKDIIKKVAVTFLAASILTLVTASLLRAYPHGSSAFIATFSSTTALSFAILIISACKCKAYDEQIGLELDQQPLTKNQESTQNKKMQEQEQTTNPYEKGYKETQ